MKPFRLCSALLGILAALCAAVSIYFAASSVSAVPRLLETPVSAQDRTESLMELIRQGKFDDASTLLSGAPELGIQSPAQGTPEALLWEAWLASLRYEFSGDCYVTQNGLARDVTVWGLDIPHATQAIGTEAQLLLEERLAQAEDAAQIYDGDGKLSKAFTDQILYDAAVSVLGRQPEEKSGTMTLYLEYVRDQWTIVPDAQLQAFLSGQIQ